MMHGQTKIKFSKANFYDDCVSLDYVTIKLITFGKFLKPNWCITLNCIPMFVIPVLEAASSVATDHGHRDTAVRIFLNSF